MQTFVSAMPNQRVGHLTALIEGLLQMVVTLASYCGSLRASSLALVSPFSTMGQVSVNCRPLVANFGMAGSHQPSENLR